MGKSSIEKRKTYKIQRHRLSVSWS